MTEVLLRMVESPATFTAFDKPPSLAAQPLPCRAGITGDCGSKRACVGVLAATAATEALSSENTSKVRPLMKVASRPFTNSPKGGRRQECHADDAGQNGGGGNVAFALVLLGSVTHAEPVSIHHLDALDGECQFAAAPHPPLALGGDDAALGGSAAGDDHAIADAHFLGLRAESWPFQSIGRPLVPQQAALNQVPIPAGGNSIRDPGSD